MAASVAFLLGGGWLVALTAALTTALIEQAMRTLNRRGLPLFFQQAVGAALATSVAVLLVAWEAQVRTSLVVAAGIVVLLPGLSLVGSAQDAISGFPITAAADPSPCTAVADRAAHPEPALEVDTADGAASRRLSLRCLPASPGSTGTTSSTRAACPR